MASLSELALTVEPVTPEQEDKPSRADGLRTGDDVSYLVDRIAELLASSSALELTRIGQILRSRTARSGVIRSSGFPAGSAEITAGVVSTTSQS
jgi:hypothetical protein